jgi:hypothetical protein
MQQYPKYLYHRTEAPVIVQDPAEQAALGAGWAETPAAFDVEALQGEQTPEITVSARKRKKGAR